jgi:hypothetical protein
MPTLNKARFSEVLLRVLGDDRRKIVTSQGIPTNFFIYKYTVSTTKTMSMIAVLSGMKAQEIGKRKHDAQVSGEMVVQSYYGQRESK